MRQKLWKNVALMRDALLAEHVNIGDSTSQVLPIMIGDDILVFDVARDLEKAGVYLNPVAYPAVKRRRSRLRVSISAAHQGDELLESAKIIGAVLRKHGVISL